VKLRSNKSAGRRSARAPAPRRRRLRIVLAGLVFVVLAGSIARAALPGLVRRYVQRALDQNQNYAGTIGEVRVHLWRGAYSVDDVRIDKTMGAVPVPFFVAKRIDLALDTRALVRGSLVGHLRIESPELNFVDDKDPARAQTGSGGPWLEVIRDLYPFRINAAEVRDGSVRLRAFDVEPPVDVHLTQLEGTLENLTNIYDETTPLFATLHAKAVAMDHARFEYEMKLDPFSYRPTYQVALRLLDLDVRRTSALARKYAGFDFEYGWFDLVLELDVKEGVVAGYAKPLFRDLKVFALKRDFNGNLFATAWEALVDVASHVFRNPDRDQVGTLIPLSGFVEDPNADMFSTLGNILRNAFVQAYLPNLEGMAEDASEQLQGIGSTPGP
jgi:Domain of Unknown Function (DUF748)